MNFSPNLLFPRVKISPFRRAIIITSAGGILFALSHCTPLPSAKTKDISKNLKIPKRYDASQPSVPEVTSGLLDVFSDSRMRSYVQTALKKNPDLRESAARLEEVGFDIRIAKSAGSPSLNINTNASRASNFNFGRQDIFSAVLDTSWEVDVWGRIRAGVTAATSDRAAAAADYAAARESIAAQTMQAYFQLVTTEKLLALSGRRLESFEKTLKLVDRRFEAGTGNLGDVNLARTDVENTRAQVSERKDTRDQAARALAALMGNYPNAKNRVYSWPVLRRAVPAGIPSDLLLKRPDIDAAYQRIRAADARVKVAHRELYPRFTLTGSGGQQSPQLSELANSAFTVWSFAGGFAGPLLAGGGGRAEFRASNARAKQALANYQSIVLNAFREVEDALGSELYLKRQQTAYQQALKAARSAELRTQRNYEQGVVEILTLLDTQRRSFDTEESLINTQSLRYQNRVSLALALGKGL